jgi:8-oxo-dGTP pyrophosphatase MutT (NUDIX family)
MADATPLERDYPDGAAALVVIARAARIAGDKTLARAARRELAEKYGIDLSFRREQTPQGGRAAP